MTFSPYLFFSGNCAEAFAFYADVFGVEARVVTAADVPPGAEMPGVDPSSVMHAAIELDGSVLMGSDDPSGDGGPKVGFSVAYSAPDVDACRRIVDTLSVGGEVTQPVTETFFSPAFGMLKDRFGVAWMIDTDPTDA